VEVKLHKLRIGNIFSSSSTRISVCERLLDKEGKEKHCIRVAIKRLDAFFFYQAVHYITFT
jgi:hypothetical protein